MEKSFVANTQDKFRQACASVKAALRSASPIPAVHILAWSPGGRMSEPRYSSIPTYLPVNYQVLNADLAFFLKEANQDFMRNSSLMSRTEPFFIYQARSLPSMNTSYGPLSVEQSVPLELLQSPGTFPASSVFTFNWKVQTFIMNTRIHLAKPKVQVLFYVAGRDWDDYSAIDKLPCVHMFAFHETQEVRGTCQLKGGLGLCVAELEPLASWFSPPSVVPGRQRNLEVSEGTPVELYYMLQSTEAGECHSEEARKDDFIRSSQEGLFGSYTSTPLRRIGGVRLYQNPTRPLAEHRLDNNFMVMVPATPMRQRETVSAFITVSAYSPVEMFTLSVRQAQVDHLRAADMERPLCGPRCITNTCMALIPSNKSPHVSIKAAGPVPQGGREKQSKVVGLSESLREMNRGGLFLSCKGNLWAHPAAGRVKLKEGVSFLGARPSNPTQWIVSQDVRSEGHRVVTLHCRRKESGYDQPRPDNFDNPRNLKNHKSLTTNAVPSVLMHQQLLMHSLCIPALTGSVAMPTVAELKGPQVLLVFKDFSEEDRRCQCHSTCRCKGRPGWVNLQDQTQFRISSTFVWPVANQKTGTVTLKDFDFWSELPQPKALRAALLRSFMALRVGSLKPEGQLLPTLGPVIYRALLYCLWLPSGRLSGLRFSRTTASLQITIRLRPTVWHASTGPLLLIGLDPMLEHCGTVMSEMGVQRVLQVDLKMESFPEPLGSRWMAWQVEYPASRATTQEAETEIQLAQEDLAGIVPLAMLRGETSQSMLKASVDTTALWFCSRSQVMGSAMGNTSGKAVRAPPVCCHGPTCIGRAQSNAHHFVTNFKPNMLPSRLPSSSLPMLWMPGDGEGARGQGIHHIWTHQSSCSSRDTKLCSLTRASAAIEMRRNEGSRLYSRIPLQCIVKQYIITLAFSGHFGSHMIKSSINILR
ncbi:hypothetical protein FQN60_018252 [Etheostoma spectabile]|uniref:Uncharacterized protein n=1 Tax=Etheostoma spectabile TaxID=54343 RepID=A0A5J5DHG6_9PERO|nr:hypothetical protein FQN60_018252 [Etheostoma spectabile]